MGIKYTRTSFLMIVLDFFLFFVGVLLGFMAALVVLPLPGTTFFNKMYRLPNNVKNFIDDAIEFFSSVLRLYFSILSWIYRTISQITSLFSKLRAKKLREEYL